MANPSEPFEKYWRLRLAVKKRIVTPTEGNFLATFFNLKNQNSVSQLGRILAEPNPRLSEWISMAQKGIINQAQFYNLCRGKATMQGFRIIKEPPVSKVPLKSSTEQLINAGKAIGLNDGEISFLLTIFYNRPKAVAQLVATQNAQTIRKLIGEIKRRKRNPETLGKNLSQRFNKRGK